MNGDIVKLVETCKMFGSLKEQDVEVLRVLW
jgi:hypothetical protein